MRIKQGRLITIDFFVKCVLVFKQKIPFEATLEKYMKDPLKIIKMLEKKQMEEMVEEVKVRIKIQKSYLRKF